MKPIPNYLPHPIYQYGLYKLQPDDSLHDREINDDQAAWNMLYLMMKAEVDQWYLSPAFNPLQKKVRERIRWRLTSCHGVADLMVDGRRVRDWMRVLGPIELIDLILPLDLFAKRGQDLDDELRSYGEEAETTEEELTYWREVARESFTKTRALLVKEATSGN